MTRIKIGFEIVLEKFVVHERKRKKKNEIFRSLFSYRDLSVRTFVGVGSFMLKYKTSASCTNFN